MPQRTIENILAPQNNCFAAIRLGMAVSVLVSHCFFLATGTVTAEPLLRWTGYTLGQHAVQVFFILSGVLVAQSLDRSRSVLDFAVARVLRIFPGFVVCVLVVACVIGPAVTSMPLIDYFSSGDLYRYLTRTVSLSTGMATLPGVFQENPANGIVNSSIWTLKYEVMCYGLCAVAGGIVIQAKRSRTVALSAGMVLLVFVFWSQPALRESNGLIENARYFALFFGVGVGAHALRRVTPLSSMVAIALAAVAFAAHQTTLREATMAISLTYAMLVIAQMKLGAVGAYTNRNDYSFGVYLYSVPLTQAVLLAVPGIGMAPLIATTLVLSLACAYASWVVIERPALGRRNSVASVIRRNAASRSVLAGA